MRDASSPQTSIPLYTADGASASPVMLLTYALPSLFDPASTRLFLSILSGRSRNTLGNNPLITR